MFYSLGRSGVILDVYFVNELNLLFNMPVFFLWVTKLDWILNIKGGCFFCKCNGFETLFCGFIFKFEAEFTILCPSYLWKKEGAP